MRWLPALVATALGIGAAAGASATTGPASAAAQALGVAVVLWGVALWAWRHDAPGTLTASALAGVIALGVASGAAAMQRAREPALERTLIEAGAWSADADAEADAEASPPLRLEGVLVADAWAAGPVTLLRVRVRRLWAGPCGCPVAVDDEVQLSVGGVLAEGQRGAWRAGRPVSTVGVLRRPSVFRNTGTPDEASQRARRRLAAVGQVKSALQVEVRRGRWLGEVLAGLRAHARRAIARAAGGDTTAAAIGTAILIGDRTGLDPALERRLQRAGTFHVVAISGGNIAVWAAGSIWITAWLTRRRSAAMGLAALTLAAYAALVGGGASVQRATGMALVGLAARWADLRGDAVNVLAVTAGVLVALDPLLVVDVAFWLTSAATLGLVVGLPGDRGGRGGLADLGRALLLTSICAEAALLPVVAAVFHQVTVAGLMLSALAVPAAGVVQVAALAAAVAEPAGGWAVELPGAVLRSAVALIVKSAAVVDVVPGLAWRVPPPSAGVVAVYYLALASWLWLRSAGGVARQRPRRAAAGLAAGAAAWIAISPLTWVRHRPGDVQFVTFDVGQGAAAFVHFPDGRRMLVDAGGATGRGVDLGTLVVGPALRARGIRWIDTLVVTHTDLDHAGGAASIIREFKPSEVWIGVPVADDAIRAAMRGAARDVGAAWREVRRGESIEIDGVRVRLAHPPPPAWERQRVRNDDSVVLTIEHGAVRLVLPGDIGSEIESDVAAAIGAMETPSAAEVGEPRRVTVLAAGHHGSAGSSSAAWLAALRPSVVIVSAGQTNPFGHPAPAMLARAAAVGARVWRTDRDGEVALRTDGRRITIASVAGRRGPESMWADYPR